MSENQQEVPVTIDGQEYLPSELPKATIYIINLYQELQVKLGTAQREAATCDLAMRQLTGLISESVKQEETPEETAEKN